MSSTRGLLAIGGFPAADLLPPLERIRLRQRAAIRGMLRAMLVLAVLTGVATLGVSGLALDAELRLQGERDRSAALLAAQLEYAEVQAKQGVLVEVSNARTGVTAGELDWSALLAEIRGVLPAGVTVVAVDGRLTATDVFGALPAGETGPAEPEPLRQDSIGSFRLTASSPTVPDIKAWLASLETLTGFAGIAPPASVVEAQDGSYTVTIEVLLNTDAYLGRFAPDATTDEGDD